MTLQTKSNLQLAIKRQSGLGVAASGAGGTGYEVLPGQRMTLGKGTIQNTVVRRDGQRKRNRHGIRSGTAAYKFPLQLGVLDPLWEAGLRGTFTPTFQVLPADVTSISCPTTTTIVGTSGSFLTKGVRKGMKLKLTNFNTTANNGKWFRIVNVTASTITLGNFNGAVPLTVDAAADTTFTIDVAKYLANPQTLTEYYHTIDEWDQDLDLSSLGTDFKVSKIEFNAQPEALIEVTITFMGLDVAPQTSGASPVLTSPTYATGVVPYVMQDGTVRVNGVDYSVLTGVQWTWDMGGEVPKVIAATGPDVILGTGGLSGSFTALRQDLAFLTAFRNETVMDMFIDCADPNTTDPRAFESFYFGNLVLTGDNPSGVAQTGPLDETVSWSAGIDDVGGADQLATMVISSSAP